MACCGGKQALFVPVQVGEDGSQRSHSARGNGLLDCRLPTLSAVQGSPAEGGLGEVGVVTAVGFLQLRVSRLGRGVWLILLVPLCNTQTQPPFPPLPDQPAPA